MVRAKIFLQSLWLQGLDWDTPLRPDDQSYWRSFLQGLPELRRLRVPRWLGWCPSAEMEIHGFADASEAAYAAVIYLKKRKDKQCGWESTLVMAKTKVAPLKQISLPRLELCAATLLVRTVAHVRQLLGWRELPVHLWSDSTVTLGWIRGHPSLWKTFVANRVSEIQTTLPDAQWHHVPGVDNPADCASRGIPPDDLDAHPLWWQGPSWMAGSVKPPGAADSEITQDLPEARVHVGATKPVPEESDFLSRFSSLTRLLRVTSWCRRWLRRGG